MGVALDELMRGGNVLHVAIDQTVAHTRAHYDTLFDELASQAHLDDAAQLHAEVDRRRSIRAVTSRELRRGQAARGGEAPAGDGRARPRS